MDWLPTWVMDAPLLSDWMGPVTLAIALAVLAGMWAWRTRRLSWPVQALIVLGPALVALAALALLLLGKVRGHRVREVDVVVRVRVVCVSV